MRQPFRALGTECELILARGSADLGSALRALTAARMEIQAAQRELSRFEPESELSRLNAAAGSWSPAGPRLRTALAAALRARDETGGRYDPTVLPALEAAGYDRSFERLEPRPARVPIGYRPGAEVEIDPGGRARVAAGAAVDLGGIGKGLIAGWALSAMRRAWPGMPGGIVDLGGDMAVGGEPPEGGPWVVGVADPAAPGAMLALLALTGGGVATSGRDRRRFGPGGRQHHLIDPSSGVPARGGPLTVTVVAGDPASAEAHATALAVTAGEETRDYLSARPRLGVLLAPESGPPETWGPLPLCPPAPVVGAPGVVAPR